jgi:putative transposase
MQRPTAKEKSTFLSKAQTSLRKMGLSTFLLTARCQTPTTSPMARTARASAGGVYYHVINRGNARNTVFHQEDDYRAFVQLLADAKRRLPMRLLAYCLMPNHFHLVLRPHHAGDLSRWMQWLLTSHVRRYHRHYHSAGRVWQGRFKAFPIQADDHLLAVWRYAERNPLRAALVRKSVDWPWSSLSRAEVPKDLRMTASPIDRPTPWSRWVDKPHHEAELTAIRARLNRGTPFGSALWAQRTATKLGLEASLRPRGRPPKNKEK